MKFTVDYKEAEKHYLNIQLEVEAKAEEKIRFQLPSWRPGRYELGNFAKNIQKWAAFDEKDSPLKAKKISKDCWEVECAKAQRVIVKYNYFAFELNAGSTFLDTDHLYVNPVNCFLYLPDRMEEKCELKLDVPKHFQIAIGLKQLKENVYKAENFDELADSPFICSPDLQKIQYQVEDTSFYLWFQGELKLKEELLINDFKRFTEQQIKLFGEFPTKEYHFFFQIVPYSAYHGVEHSNNTVILLGPTYAVLDKEGRYEDLLGVSSHELFHTWNVKRIRPIEMWPYDFQKENYSRLGYLSEGATTWYGDIMLLRSKVFNTKQFFTTFNQLLNRHFNNPGIKNLSVADSSFDSWLDGYSLGVPNRKSSIYTEGALITFVLDSIIRRNTNHKKSFDDVMKSFYSNYFKKDKGISEADYQREVEHFAEVDLSDFFEHYVNGTEDLSSELKKAMNFFGLEYEKKASKESFESRLGVKVGADQEVIMIFPESPAEKAGLSLKDKITSINGNQLNQDLSKWLDYYATDTVCLGLFNSLGVNKSIEVELTDAIYFADYEVRQIADRTDEQIEAWNQLIS